MSVVRITEGKTGRRLITYSAPLILENLFQSIYNTMDSVTVSRLIGEEALATVGTASSAMNITILGISGIRTGASVLISNFFGANNEEMVRKETATTAVFGLFSSLVVVTLGIMVVRLLLRVLQVPGEILGISTIYLQITFLGAPFTHFYNAVLATLKSVEDPKTPLRSLVSVSALGGFLDIIFIGGFRFGIVCSAVATATAEMTSAVLYIGYAYRKVPLL